MCVYVYVYMYIYIYIYVYTYNCRGAYRRAIVWASGSYYDTINILLILLLSYGYTVLTI